MRELESFAAQFLLTDDGELKSILLNEQTLADLRAHEYPILNSARTQSYADFDSSETDSKAEHVLYDGITAARHPKSYTWERLCSAGRDGSLRYHVLLGWSSP